MALTPSQMASLGTPASPFCLPDTEGRYVSLEDYKDTSGLLVIFMCNHCPYVIHLREQLAVLTRELMKRGLDVVAINSNDAVLYPQDGPEAMKIEHKQLGYPFPYLFDEDQSVAIAYQATCTPDFFLFDAQLHLVYRGQFDQSRPGNDIPVTGDALRAACEMLLSTGVVSEKLEQRPSLGCNIKWKTY